MRINLKHGIASLLRHVALAITLAAGGGIASAGTIHVAIDTSGFGVTSGYLDMQLSASAGVPLATAVLSNMAGFDSSAFIDSWGVTPTAGGYTFRNDTSNDLFHAVAFGGLLSFDLTFDGAYDPLTKYVSHFVVSAFDDTIAPLGAFDPVTGALADFSWTPARSAGGDGSIGVHVSDPNVSVVPEPADWLLMGLGLAAMALVLRNPTVPRPFHLLGRLALAGAASMLALPAQAQSRLTVPSANVTASSSDSNVPGNANDGSLSTRWSADATTAPQWLQYKLGGCYKISSAQLAWYNGDARKYNFTLELSNDASSWTDAFTGTNSGTSAGLQAYALGDRPANYLRLRSTGSNVNKWVSLSEMQVWTNGAGTCSSSTGLDPSKPPGVNFDLSGFKLQTFDSSLNVKEVNPIGSYTDQYFYTDAATGAMTFYVPSGAGSTANSTYPRSELRALSTWRIGATHTLAVSVKVLQQPATGSIIIGQIHGEQTGGSELLKLRWVKGDILMGVKPTFGATEQKILIKSGVALGENIDYVIKMVGSVVTVTVNGVSKSFTYNTASWSAIDLYFKLGAYSQDSSADGTHAKVAVTAVK